MNEDEREEHAGRFGLERFAWVAGVFLCGAMTIRLVSTGAPLRPEDDAFVRGIVEVHRALEQRYVEPVNDAQLRAAAIEGMLRPLQDEHTMYFAPREVQTLHDVLGGSFRGIGVLTQPTAEGLLRIITPLDGSPAAAAGLQPDDLILRVDGRDIHGMGADSRLLIRGEPGTSVTLRVRSVGGEERDVTVVRAQVFEPIMLGYMRNADNSWRYFVNDDLKIAYVRFTQFTPDSAKPLRATLQRLVDQGMKGLILDLRFNGGGDLEQAGQIAELFLQPGQIIVTTQGRASPRRERRAASGTQLADFPVVILVNEDTASASEIVAGAMADHARTLRDGPRRVVLVGARTYGKGSVQEVRSLPGDGGDLKLTIAYWYTPSGRRVERAADGAEWGVEPDVVVPMDEEARQRLLQVIGDSDSPGYRSYLRRKGEMIPRPNELHNDPQFNKALEVLAAQLLPPPSATMPSTAPAQ